jgi:hypothetical protein
LRCPGSLPISERRLPIRVVRVHHVLVSLVALPGDDPVDSLGQVWLDFSRYLYGDQCPVNASLTEAVASDRTLLQLVRDFPAYSQRPMMFLAAVRYLVLGGVKHPIAQVYQRRRPTDLNEISELLGDFCREHEAELREILASRQIQTNEPTRSAPLALGIARAASVIGEPVGLIDAGASAGLNLALDRYYIDYGSGRTLGTPESPVRLASTLQGTNRLPMERLPLIERRIGIDRDPIDLRDEKSRRWIFAFAWPGTERETSLKAALDLLADDPPEVRHGDMGTDMSAILEEMEPLPRVVVTSWSLSFLSAPARQGFEHALAAAGKDGPVAWVCCDVAGVSPLFSSTTEPPAPQLVPSFMGLAVFDGQSVRAELLANVDSYGRWVDWIEEPGARAGVRP